MLSIINPGSKTLRISCPTKRKEGIEEYEYFKSKIKKSTLQYGAIVSTYHFMFHTPIDGISASIGTVASYIYVNSLSEYVDNIERSFNLNRRLLVPTSLALAESMWNSSDFPFDFNMGATLFGFLVYKIAFYQIVAEEILKDNEDLSELDQM
uniref:CGL160/ATPI domain-containing protein n=1 Tax=Bathycoccus sp. RCC716 virus 2 TaxID=2530039 RepID=A0A7S6NY72_9PHYC|nr:hypothetical protein [Bathycoccus sp. RCC716 virus 2]|tara:strand:+ start:197 stop:652 length:456 start_codon:yes stop_codon:yes gene_type:complete